MTAPPYLGINFGTTSTKSARIDVETGALTDVRHHPAIPPTPGPPGRFEVPLEAIRDRFLGLCASYARDLGAPPAGIVICSEMHGFALVDDAGRPQSPYISWKDERRASRSLASTASRSSRARSAPASGRSRACGRGRASP